MKPWRSLVALVVASSALVPVAPAAASSPHPCVVSDDANLYTGNDHRPKRQPLPATFTPVRAFFCADDQRLIPGHGRWDVLLGRQLVGNLTELTTALRQPDEQPPVQSTDPGAPVYACPAVLIIAPTIVLYSASGKAFRPRFPLNWCGQPQDALLLAVAHLHARTVQVLLRKQYETPAGIARDKRAAKAGCPTAWKDSFRWGTPGRLSPGGRLTGFPATVSLCRLTAPAVPGDSVFVAGRRLTKAETATLLAALTLPGRPGGCSKPSTGLLLVSSPRTIAEVEIGGCARVVRQDKGISSIGRADTAVLATITPS